MSIKQKIVFRGPLDLTKQIEDLQNENKELKARLKDQKEISQGHRKIIGDTYKELDKSKKRECKCNTKTSTSS